MSRSSRLVRSPLLAEAGFSHGFTTRLDGVSTGRYQSLNVGGKWGDDPDAVRHNRELVANDGGFALASLYTAKQVHGARVLVVDGSATLAEEADALTTTTQGHAVGVYTADCVPILVGDRDGRVAAAHAGWRGALDGVVQAAVDAMVELGGDPDRMVAAVGPCIGPASYEVGLEFLERFEADSPGSGQFFHPDKTDTKRMFDLPAFVLDRLRTAGIERREWVGHDTCAQAELFFSNRRAVLNGEGDYGRLLSAIALDA